MVIQIDPASVLKKGKKGFILAQQIVFFPIVVEPGGLNFFGPLHVLFLSGLWIWIHLNPDPDPSLFLNPDPV
jgi:hypothetical protein